MTAIVTGNTVLGHPYVELQEFLQKKKQIFGCPLLVKPSTSPGINQPIS